MEEVRTIYTKFRFIDLGIDEKVYHTGIGNAIAGLYPSNSEVVIPTRLR
jgi:hypothetical protein